jgi:predicted secreted hydrolase
MSRKNRYLMLVFLPIFCLGCDTEQESRATLELTELLATDDTSGFSRAFNEREFTFPDDHGAHPDFRNEWWYLTGNLQDQEGRRFGYQVTFFRNALASVKPQVADQIVSGPDTVDSAWSISNVWMAHAAITDSETRNHIAQQRFSRASPGLAGAITDPFKVWLDDWKLSGQGNEFPWQLDIDSEAFSLHLNLDSLKPVVLQGDHGLSKKSDQPGNASYYYSYTRLKTTGNISLAGEEYTVDGLSWFDREWSTSTLDRQQSGWNWFSLQLDSGEDMMFFQLLDMQGQADGNSQGSWVDELGVKTALGKDDIYLEILDEWLAPDGTSYPIRWLLEYPARNESWIVVAVFENQFMDLAVRYWEGAVEVLDVSNMKLIGRGYLEMTRTGTGTVRNARKS